MAYDVSFLRRLIGQRGGQIGNAWEKSAPKLFVHIPKTAGTSLRSAAESCFGSTRVLRDYGPESTDTSQSVKKHVYESGDPTAIVDALAESQARLVSGHIPLTKYCGVFCLSDTATLLRNPVEQVVSHYQHMVRHYGHQGTLMEFARQARYQNVQSQYVGMLDPGLIGVIGLTESYRSFLNLLNQQWGWSLPHRRRNVRDRLGVRRIRLPSEDRLEIARLNSIDERLYRRAAHVFNNRKRADEMGIRPDIRGRITRAVAGRKLEGWALDMRSPSPVTVDVLVNCKYAASIICDMKLFENSGWKLPGEGLAGFTIGTVALEEGSVVEIRDPEHKFILDSRQVLPPG